MEMILCRWAVSLNDKFDHKSIPTCSYFVHIPIHFCHNSFRNLLHVQLRCHLLIKSYSTHTTINIRGSSMNHLQKYPAEETVGCLPSSAAVSLLIVVNANIPSHLTLRGVTALLWTLNIPWQYDGMGRSLLCWLNSGAHKTHPGGRCGGCAAVQMARQLRCCDSYTDRPHLQQENNPQKQKNHRKLKLF